MLDDAGLETFQALLTERLGFRFDAWSQASVAEILRDRLSETGSPTLQAYLQGLAGGGSAAEWRLLAERLTVGETYFFRHQEQFDAVSALVLPELAASGRKIRVLSAGCASGEEAYTLAILAGEQPRLRAQDVAILGVDLNPAFLRRAAAARYSPWSLRATPEAVKARYFEPQGRDFRLSETVRRQVRFEERNLLAPAPEFWQPASFEVIFCRNVLIYFSAEAIAKLVSLFAEALVPGGYLFLGPAETLRGVSKDFHLRHTHGAFYYQRKGASELALATPSPFTAYLPPEPVLDVDADVSWVEAIHQAAERITSLTAERPAAPSAPRPPARTWDLSAALSLFREERFTEAMAALQALPEESASDADVRLLTAAVLTNLGRVAEAEASCHAILVDDDCHAGAHYLLALCREHAGDPAAARRHDEIATYLDPLFAMPHFHLGLLAKRANDPGAAREAFARALWLLPREDAARILLFGGGFSREALQDLCRAEHRKLEQRA